MRKIYITEKQKNHLKKAIAAQDQVGGKVNAGIMGAVTGMVCEGHGDDIQTWYRGYNADYPNLGVPQGGGLWLTDEYDYAQEYANQFDNGKVAAVTIDFTKINWATETEIYEADLDPYDSGEEMAEAVRQLGFNAWICDYYDSNARGLCLLDMSAVVSTEDCNEMVNEWVEDGKYKLGFEKGGFEQVGHVVNEELIYQHGSTPHKELPDFQPKLQPLIMYKQFKLRLDKNGNNLAPGYVFPLYVNTEEAGNTGRKSQGLKLGVWYRSGEGECWLDTRNNRLYTVGKGYGTDGNTLSKLSYRPGWHLTTTPWGNQRGENKPVGGVQGSGNNYMNTRDSEVWAKVEICVDIDATERARAMSKTPADQCLQSIGDREFYKYRTNSNATDDQSWYIVSMIRIIDVLDDDTVDSTNDKYYADLLVNNPGKKINSDPYSYTKDLVNDIPYWKMPRTSGKRYTKDELQAMGYNAVEPTQLNESPDGVLGFDLGYRDPGSITFLYSERDGQLLSGVNTTHPQLIRADGGNPDDEDYADMEMRGRYWPDDNIISFWQTPSPDKLRYVVSELGITSKKTLIVDVWDWGSFDLEIPYPWFFDGFLDDFYDKIRRIQLEDEETYTFRVEFKDGAVYYCEVDGILRPTRQKAQMYGQVCESHEWCDDFDYAPYFKSICDFFQEKGIEVEPYPNVKLHKGEQEGLYIKTGYYDPDTKEVHVFLADRHPKDVLRSFAHELIHHNQNLRGTLGGYKGQTLDGDKALQKLESEAYLLGNIYFRKWTEELRPTLPGRKQKLNESMQDIYNMADDFDTFGAGKIVSEFLSDRKRGVAKKQWDLIPAQQYQNLLSRYMQDPIMARIPDNIVYDWFTKVVQNAFDIEWITELAGHSQGFPADEVQEELDYEFGEGKYEIHDYSDGYDALESLGFYEWCSLPDGSDGWSDYGIAPIFKELSYYKPGMPAGDLLVLINRVLHIGHCRGDLASAFIEGGSRACSAISGIMRESIGEAKWNGDGDEWKGLEPAYRFPQYLYHASDRRNRESIMAFGLQPSCGEEYYEWWNYEGPNGEYPDNEELPELVFLSDKPYTWYGNICQNGETDIYQIDTSQLDLEYFFYDPDKYQAKQGNYCYTETIPPSAIKLYEKSDEELNEGVEGNSNFASWFAGSKVVDKNGNPLPMYHGTDAEFGAFSKDYFTHGSTAYLGIGFNFTCSDATARGYGKNVHEVYLRAVNPMTNLKKTITFNQVIRLIQTIDGETDPDGRITTGILGYRVENLTFKDVWKAAKTIYDYCENDGDIYTQFGVCYSGAHDENVVAAFQKLGFDSCIDYQEDTGRIRYVVVFEPNQIKSINAQNFNPESDEMIDEDFDMGETTEPDEVDLSSFKVNNSLNPRFWEGGKLNQEIRLKLMEIADDFIDYLGVDFEPVDIIVTGSIANYNWNQEHSDVDLHIVANFADISDKTELVKDFFDDKRRLWNSEHEGITIAGFPVELYVQDANEPHASSGVYSIEKNKWLVKPSISKLSPDDMDDDIVKRRVAKYMNEIDAIVDEYEERLAELDLTELYDKADDLFDRIKNERRRGFTSGGGEYNNGNIIFKTLRRNGYIDKLLKVRTKAYDETKSLLNEKLRSQKG